MTAIQTENNIISWLEEEYKKEQEEREEFLKTHFSNGVLRYEYRTEKDRVENCGRLIYVYTGVDGTEKEYREYRCKVLTGKNACPKCLAIREMQRAGNFSERIESVSDRQLYEIVATDDREMKRIRESAYRNGYEYFAVPTGSEKEKIVIVDGRVKGSEPIHPGDAASKLKDLAGIIYDDRSIRVSGTLGINRDKKDNQSTTSSATVSVISGGFIWSGKEPTKAEKEIANVKAMVIRDGSALSLDGVITEDNVQEVISEREQALDKIYRAMGYKRKRVAEHSLRVDIDEMNKLWAAIVIGKDRFRGDIRTISPFSRMLVSRTIDERNSRLDGFNESVDLASRMFSL